MKVCVADLEANGFLEDADRVWCGVFIDEKTEEVTEFRPDQVQDMLRFMDTLDVCVIHNGTGYDYPLLRKLYGYDFKGVRIDTLIMSRLQRPDRQLPFNCKNRAAGPHSVEAWAYRVGRRKPVHEDWTQFSDEMLDRCREDTFILLDVYRELKKEGGKEWRRAHPLTHNLFEILHQQEQYGWLVDQDWMGYSIQTLSRWMDRIDKVVVPTLPPVLVIEEDKKNGTYNYVKKPFLKSGKHSQATMDWFGDNGTGSGSISCVAGTFSRVSFRPVNLNSNSEVKDWLLREGWIPEAWNYKKVDGKLVKDEDGQLIPTSPKLKETDPFIGVEGKVGRLLVRRVQCRHRRSQIEGWFKVIRPDGRLSQGISGICTTARLKHKVIVNVPGDDAFFGKWMRKCFICKPGYKIVGVDSAGCQNRMLAARVGNPFFTETLINGDKEKGTSIHQVNQKALAAMGVNVSYKQSKNLNYAFMFGARDPKLGAIIGKGKEVGATVRAALLGVAPGFEDLVTSLTEEWRSNAKSRRNKWDRLEYYDGWVVGLDGRPIFIETEHQILVYVLQSDEAIMMQTALVLLKKWLDDMGWEFGREYGWTANIHDEFQAEVRDDCVEEYCKLGEAAITEAAVMLGIQCPHKGEAKVGLNWFETH